METEPNATVVEKAVALVKDIFGIQPEAAQDLEAQPEFHDTAPEITAENAMRLDPNAYLVETVGQIIPGSFVEPMDSVAPMGETDVERLRRQVDEPQPKSAFDLNAQNARAEDNG